jgi:hypothetical protein
MYSWVLLDWPYTWFRFFGHAATYTGSFCVFGPQSPWLCLKSESKYF